MSHPRSTPPSAPGALACLSLSVLLSSLGTSIANVGLPSLVQAFGASFQQVQWVVLSYLLAMTALVVGAGQLGDFLGRRRLLLVGVGLFTLASALCALAPSLEALVAARALQGLGAAAMMTLSMALVGETVPKDRTGSAMGLLGSVSAAGTALGPSLGGALIAWANWRMLFLVTVPLGMGVMLLALRHLPAQAAITRTQAKAPFVSLASLRENTLWASLIMNALVATVMMATLVVGPFFLSGGLHLGPAWVGATMSVGPALSMLSGFPAGRLVDRWGAQTMLRCGLLVMLAGSLGLALLPAVWGWAGYLVAMAFLTPGYQLFLASNNTAVMTRVPADRRGKVSGLLNLARNLGLIAGASVMGAVFAAATPDLISATPAALLNGLQLTFSVAAGLLVLSLATALVARPAASRL